MNDFKDETFSSLLEKATKEFKEDKTDYKSQFENAWNYISTYTIDNEKINILNEIKNQIESLSISDKFSKFNLLLIRDICISFEIIRPIENNTDNILQ